MRTRSSEVTIVPQYRYEERRGSGDPSQGSRPVLDDEVGKGFAPATKDNHVAKLQSLVYTRFGGSDEQAAPPPVFKDSMLESTISLVSRIGGIVLFFAALAAMIYLLF